jgi:hypothetical protein
MEIVHQSAIKPRLYEKGDAKNVDKIINENRGHNVRLASDRIVVLGNSGLLVWRPGCIVHELHVGNGLRQRQRADSLVGYAIADALSQPFDLHEGIFVTDSDRMAGYALDIGAIEEVGKRVFTLRIR